MVVSDQTILVAIALLFNYALVYRKWLFLGGIGFIIIGSASLFALTGNDMWFAFFIMLIGVILVVQDIPDWNSSQPIQRR